MRVIITNPIRIWQPRFKKRLITTEEELDLLIEKEFPGLKRNPRFNKLLLDAKLHHALSKKIVDRQFLKPRELTCLVHEFSMNREENEKFLAETLWKDLLNTHKTNLLRDDSVCMVNSVRPLYPYLSLDVVNIAARIPIEFKVADPDDVLRKLVLRMVGKMYDLPDEIVNKKKKAVQFGSGVTKAIRQIARKNGFNNSRDYLAKKYEKLVEES